MKKKASLLFLILMVIILGNIKPTKYLFDYLLDEKHYQYSNHSGDFTVTDRSGNNLKGVKLGFVQFKKEMANSILPNDTILYRVFWKNPFCFWRWGSYFNDARYDLPYISIADIQKNRAQIQKLKHLFIRNFKISGILVAGSSIITLCALR